MALCGKIVDFVGTYLVQHLNQRKRIAEIGIVEVKIGVSLEVGYPLAVVD